MANLFYEFNNNKRILYCEDLKSNLDLYYEIAIKENLPLDFFQIYLNGKYLQLDETPIIENVDLYLNVNLPLPGGKGGFGSMLRAIGAQIEKTTNKEACRDLSGRRLRDVNAEKRIKNWIKRKADRIKEQEQKKLEKLERLTQGPKVEFKDDEYLEQKDVIPQKVDDAINYILEKKKKTKKSTVSSTITSSTLSNSEPSTSRTISNSGPSTSASSDDNESIDNTNNLKEKPNNNSNSDKSDDNSNNSNDKSIKLNQLNKRKVNDEPKIVSKKKKVQLWLGDDSEDDDE